MILLLLVVVIFDVGVVFDGKLGVDIDGDGADGIHSTKYFYRIGFRVQVFHQFSLKLIGWGVDPDGHQFYLHSSLAFK